MQVMGGDRGGEQASPLGQKRKDEVIVARARPARSRGHTWPFFGARLSQHVTSLRIYVLLRVDVNIEQ